VAIEDALRAVLLGDADVAALVAARVYPIKLPQSAVFPAVVYQRVSTVGGFALGTPVGPTRSRVQLSAWAATYGQARQLGEAVVHALNGWAGTAGGQDVQLVRLVNWLDDYEPGPPERFRVIADVYVFSMEGVAA
jgi:hypothetical protein